jgi:hypothetical protein
MDDQLSHVCDRVTLAVTPFESVTKDNLSVAGKAHIIKLQVTT